MKLSTMMKVLETVDSEWRSPLAEDILQRWGYDPGSAFFLRASANFVFIFKKKGKLYYLRFNDSSERNVEEIKAELDIIQYLAKNSLHVAEPILSLNEKYIEIIETEWGVFYSVVFEALSGEHYDIEDLTDEQTYIWGQSLGHLHRILKEMPNQFLKNRLSWKEQLKNAAEIIPQSEISAHRELERIQIWAEGLSITKENFGLIHYDFELDNILFDHLQTGMIDFDDCVSCWYIADIIYALRDVGKFDPNSPVIKKFIEGYESKTELDANILLEAPQFERMHNLIFFARLIRSVDIVESQDYPDQLSNLRKKLCGYIDGYRHSFESEII